MIYKHALGLGVLIYHPDKRLDCINLLQFLSASLMEEAGSVANPLADELTIQHNIKLL
jgi:hypothetical protein